MTEAVGGSAAAGAGSRVRAHQTSIAGGAGNRLLTARQAVLPSLGQIVRQGRDDEFAHPAERDLARLLTFYGVRWAYEPTTFALSATGDDREEYFTPDFYLPDYRLYLELTTMRQRLVTRKNRKLRRLRERYPDVGIKLLYRRDYQQLVDAYEAPVATAGDGCLGHVVFTEAVIADRVKALAEQIAHEHAARARDQEPPPVLIGVGRGSQRFHEALAAALGVQGLELSRDWIDLTRYAISGDGGRVRVRRPPTTDLMGRRVLLVEDVVSTGLSLAYLVGWLQRHGARDVAACTLLDRASARLVQVPVRHVGFEVSASILAGFGLSLRRQFSDLPYIAEVVPAGDPGGSV